MSSLGSTGDSPVSSLASSLAPSLASSRESVASFGSLERHVEEEKYSKSKPENRAHNNVTMLSQRICVHMLKAAFEAISYGQTLQKRRGPL